MGEVFRAVDEQLERPVAVKLMLPADSDPSAAERFRREARAAARLNDPHVVAVYDFGQQGDQFFLVMELVEGRTVGAELAELGPLPMARAIDIVEQSAAGLAAAHRQGVIHRDVKPGNLLVAPGGTVKVADFGIAQLPGEAGTTLTAVGQIIGSTLYLAPERARGGQAAAAADVYALGCVLYQLVTGQPPFTGEHPTAILYQHVDTAPVPPSSARPELAGSFETVLLSMLAKDPADRPTAEAIAAGALRAQPAGGSVAVPPATLVAAPVVGAAAAPVVPADTAPMVAAETPVAADAALQPAAHGKRRKALLAGGIAIAATAAAVLAGVLMNDDGTKLPATTDVGPEPSIVTGTPGAGTSSVPTTDPTQYGTESQAPQSTSPQPSQTTSQQPSATPPPSSATPSPGTETKNTPTPSPTPDRTAPSSTPTKSSPSPTPSPSSTPEPEDPPTTTPPAGTPTTPDTDDVADRQKD
ncbi:serine/threonine-protein kinase [Kribbella sp. CA-293567]|uniref:serine/threonine-protein kinase n=1 Tax=Kribbella sp. CA-293567 TaxID=3002436 RepID=UPI0022DDFAB8|nr:serine/threonine-protein kinase [Kribbella sp. CA-293567]WBQ07942.1 serine/threonine-protein kinase [Kribbella sp. CA-293567]